MNKPNTNSDILIPSILSHFTIKDCMGNPIHHLDAYEELKQGRPIRVTHQDTRLTGKLFIPTTLRSLK